MTQVIWSGTGNLVAIIADEGSYVLRFDRAAFDAHVENVGGAENIGDEGVEEVFDIVAETSDKYVPLLFLIVFTSRSKYNAVSRPRSG